MEVLDEIDRLGEELVGIPEGFSSKASSSPSPQAIEEQLWKVKTLFYEQTLSLQQENERFYSSLSEQTDSIAKQKEERILFYEKKLEVRGGGEGGEEGEGGEGGGYDEGFLERYRKRREEGREVREREVGEVRERVREKRRGMEERRGEVERQVGIVAKSEEGIRGEKGVVCGVVKGVGGWVGGVGERCRLLQSKLVEVCGEGGGGWGGMLDDEEQEALMQAAMEVASESKKIMEKAQEIEHIKEYCCRSFVLSCNQLVGMMAKYIRVLSVVLFKGGKSQTVIDDCQKSYILVQNLLKNILVMSRNLLEKYDENNSKGEGVVGGGGRAEVETKKKKSPLESFLFQKGFPFPIVLCMSVDVKDFDKLSSSLVRIFSDHTLMLELIGSLVAAEVEQAGPSPGTLLRSGSMANKTMTDYAHRIGHDYLLQVLEQPLTGILESDEVIVLDPGKVKRVETWKDNVRRFCSYCQTILESIINSVDQMPLEMKAACSLLKKEVQTKFPQQVGPCLGGFIFLRFFCPAIASPARCGLTKKSPSRDSLRTLVSIAKVLQNLANRTTFGEKTGGYYACMNPFLEKNSFLLDQFFDKICEAGPAIQGGGLKGDLSDDERTQATQDILQIMKKEEIAIRDAIVSIKQPDSDQLLHNFSVFLKDNA